jgi:hypothetical protein
MTEGQAFYDRGTGLLLSPPLKSSPALVVLSHEQEGTMVG